MNVEQNALLKSQLDRQKIRQDNQKLTNRITMLELEEKKMFKKIDDTRKRAEQIMKVKQENEERLI